MTDRPERTSKYAPPTEVKPDEPEDKNPSLCYVRLDMLADGTYKVSNDAPLTLAHAAMLSELARDIANHFHEQAVKNQIAKGNVQLPREDARMRLN